MVGIESLLHLIGEDLLRTRVAELPDIDGVEPEVALALRAPGDRLLALVVDVTLAVVPEADRVKVLEVVGLGRALQRLEEIVVDVYIIGELVEDRVGIGGELSRICL